MVHKINLTLDCNYSIATSYSEMSRRSKSNQSWLAQDPLVKEEQKNYG